MAIRMSEVRSSGPPCAREQEPAAAHVVLRKFGPQNGLQDPRPKGNQVAQSQPLPRVRDAEFEQKMTEVLVRLS